MIASQDARAVVAEVTARLQSAGVPSATADARWLVSHILGTSPAGLAFAGPLDPAELAAVDEATSRRERREPLQHILGTAPFGDLDLVVGPGVFVPRPETEVLAQYAIDWARRQEQCLSVVDACSGSGALALAIACHTEAEVVAIEASAAALPWLERNVTALSPRFTARGCEVTVVAGDCADPGSWPEVATVDLVVANPPYIPDGCIPRDPEVREHDPAAALFGGPDGFDVIRPLIDRAHEALRPGGLLLIEHGDEQGEPEGVPALIRRRGGFADVVDRQDWSGRPRFTSAVRRD